MLGLQSRRLFASKNNIYDPTARELASFRTIQELLSLQSHLVHPDPERQMFLDLDASKEYEKIPMDSGLRSLILWNDGGRA